VHGGQKEQQQQRPWLRKIWDLVARAHLLVTVREGEKTRQMTKLEAMLQAHAMKAMKSDARSASFVIGLVTRMGLLADQEEEVLASLPNEDAAIIEDYLRRNTDSPKSGVSA
jgi:hypothetical protein